MISTKAWSAGRGVRPWWPGSALLPSVMGTLLEEAEVLRALASGWSEPGTEVKVSAHVGAGVLRVAVSELPEGDRGFGAWLSALRGLRERLEDRGGSLTLSSGPPVLMRGRWCLGRKREGRWTSWLG